ncbi:MAG: TonB-dependent receptor [Bryobacter sp.]|nr:TonB-dependent receptor [Bryobacter sp.]
MRNSILLVIALASSLSAQFDSGVVLGTVKDANGGVVKSAAVTLRNLDTGIQSKALSDDTGDYVFPAVLIGRYSISAEMTGFSTARVEEFRVTVQARQRIDLTLQVGQVSEVVNVTEEAPLLETASSSKGQVITQSTIVNMPILGRSYANLALLVPGVRQSQVGNQGDIAFRREGSYNVNGLRSVFNNFLLDGIDNNFYGTTNQGFSNQAIQPSPDSVAEFRMSINAYSAEYGRTGGAVMNVASRSGTNELHGSVWNFFQNTAMNAYGFFRPRDAAGREFPKPQVNRNQFGFVLGGPVIKNRTFFFADYEGSRWIQSPFGQATIPSLAQRSGVLAADVRAPFAFNDSSGRSIAAGTLFPAGTAVPMTAFARRVLNEIPAPNLPGAPNIYAGAVRNKLDEDKGAVKIDHRLTDSLSTFFRYAQRRQNIEQPGLITGFSGGNAIGFLDVFNQQGIFGTTWTKSPTEIMEVRFAVTRLGMDRLPASIGGPSMRELFGITGLPEGPRIQGGVTPQDIAGFARIGRQSTNPQAQFPTTINTRVNYSKIINRHTLKTGYELLYLSAMIDDTNPLYGLDAYGGTFSRPAGGTGAAVNYNLADFFFGARSSYQLATQVEAQMRQQGHWFYLQDDWKVSDKLTLNLGVRYEITSPVYDANNKLANFDPLQNKLVVAESGSWEKRSLRNSDWNNFAPRAGFAYQMTSKTVLRGGYGLGYNYWNRMASAELMNTNAPFVTRFSQQNSAANLGAVCSGNTWENCFRRTQDGVILHMQQDMPWGYIQNWHFTVQQQFGKDTLLDVAYVGNKGSLLPLLGDLNQARPITAAELAQGLTPLGTLNARRPYRGFGNITAVVPTGFSNYHALQVKFEHRTRDLLFLNAFTYSKAIDNVGQVLETTNGGSPNPQDIRNPANDRGRSSFDQRVNNTSSVVWQVPVGKGRRYGASMNGVLDALAGGWELSSTITLVSGQPVNPRYGDTGAFLSDNQPDFLGGVALRPNYVGGSVLLPEDQRITGAVRLLDRNAVAIPTADAPFGTLGRNPVSGFPLYQVDTAVQKHFAIKPLGEAGRLTFRSEFFNLFNRTNFAAPVVDVRNAAYGNVTSTFDPRLIQLALKLQF